MPINKSWVRWSKASISKHFNDVLSIVFPLFIENQHRDTDEKPNFFELRIDGPGLIETSKDCWKLFIDISVLCQSVMNDTDYHIIDDMSGVAQSAFTKTISVSRFGNRVNDDDSFLGCYVRQDNRRQFVEASQFGQIGVRTELLQSMVEGHYIMDLQV